MAPLIPSIDLNNGAKMPVFGLGTFRATDADQLKTALRTAIDAGYRLIDTAYMYENEAIIGEVLQEYFNSGKLKREEIFITTKLPLLAMEPAAAEACIKDQLSALQLDYIDLYLIHMPCAVKAKEGVRSIPEMCAGGFEHLNDLKHIDVWRILEKYHEEGNLKAIGISNFNAQQIQDLYDKAEIKPAILQIELHIYWPQHELQQLCSKLGITVTSYATIGSPGHNAVRQPHQHSSGAAPMEDPMVVELAEKYGKTPSQILLRHVIQRGVVVIPKSTSQERVKQNIDIFDFELTPKDQQKLLDIKHRDRLFQFPFLRGHPHYPFDDDAKTN